MTSFRRLMLLLIMAGGCHSVYSQLKARFIAIDSSSNDTVYNFQIFRDGVNDEQIWPDSHGIYMIDTSGDFKIYLLSEGYSDVIIYKNQLSSYSTVYLHSDFALIQEIRVNSRTKRRTITVGRRKTIAESNLPLGKDHYLDCVIDLSSYKGQLNLISINLDVSKNEDDSSLIPITWQLFRLSSSFPYYELNKNAFAFNIEETLMQDSLIADRFSKVIVMDLKNFRIDSDDKILLLRIKSSSSQRIIFPVRHDIPNNKSKCQYKNCLCITYNGYSRGAPKLLPLAQNYYYFDGAYVNSSWSKHVVPRLSITLTQRQINKRTRIRQ